MRRFPPPSEAQARLIWTALTGAAVALLALLVAALVWGLGRTIDILAPVLWPIAVAAVLAYLLDPVVDFLERHKVKRARAIGLVFAMALVLVLTLFSSIVPQLIRQSRELAVSVPAYAAKLQQKAENWIEHPPELLKSFLREKNKKEPGVGEETAPPGSPPPDTAAPQTNAPPQNQNLLQGVDQKSLQTATGMAAKWLTKAGSWAFGQFGRVASWFGVLAGLALIPVYTFYFLLEKHPIAQHWTNYLPVRDSAFKKELVFILDNINNYLIAFFRGQVLVAICDGVLYGIGFLLLGLEFGLLIGVVAMFLTIIPYIGAIIVCCTALIISIVQFGDWMHPLMVAGVFGVVQLLEGLVIAPKIMGDRVGLHPVTIIIAVVTGTTLLGGILGGILAIPLTAALRVIMFRYVWINRVRAGEIMEPSPSADSNAAKS